MQKDYPTTFLRNVQQKYELNYEKPNKLVKLKQSCLGMTILYGSWRLWVNFVRIYEKVAVNEMTIFR